MADNGGCTSRQQYERSHGKKSLYFEFYTLVLSQKKFFLPWNTHTHYIYSQTDESVLNCFSPLRYNTLCYYTEKSKELKHKLQQQSAHGTKQNAVL